MRSLIAFVILGTLAAFAGVSVAAPPAVFYRTVNLPDTALTSNDGFTTWDGSIFQSGLTQNDLSLRNDPYYIVVRARQNATLPNGSRFELRRVMVCTIKYDPGYAGIVYFGGVQYDLFSHVVGNRIMAERLEIGGGGRPVRLDTELLQVEQILKGDGTPDDRLERVTQHFISMAIPDGAGGGWERSIGPWTR